MSVIALTFVSVAQHATLPQAFDVVDCELQALTGIHVKMSNGNNVLMSVFFF